jgi:pimeloyl-ACP methyl ester carboxylesterase
MAENEGMLSALSSARRRLVIGVAALLLATAVAVAVMVARRGASPANESPAQDRPGPVLLVPGYGGSTKSLEALAGRLRRAGREAEVLALPGGGVGDLREQAQALDAAARRAMTRAGAASVDVVGYSAGGVVARLWADDRGRAVARRVVTLGSPHHGTVLASLAGAFLPDQCPLACQQLAPGSDLLNRLNATPEEPRLVSVWTTADEVIRPPESARLAGAGGLDVAVQSVCPDSKVRHGELPKDPVAQGIVLAQLTAGPPAALTRADCARLGGVGS